MAQAPSNGQVLPDLSQVLKDQAAMIEALKAQINDMRNAPANRATFKVSEKGCCSVYGLNRRGIHLYASQWERIAKEMPRILAFIAAHPELARKAAADEQDAG